MVDATRRAAELADELGVDLASLTGTGKGGRITVADVRGAQELTVYEAVRQDLAAFGELARSGLAATALALALELDDADNSATSKSMCARALLDTLDRLRALAPEDEGRDGLDELSARRATRLARSAAT